MNEDSKKKIQFEINMFFAKKPWIEKIKDAIHLLKEDADIPEVADTIKFLETKIGK